MNWISYLKTKNWTYVILVLMPRNISDFPMLQKNYEKIMSFTYHKRLIRISIHNKWLSLIKGDKIDIQSRICICNRTYIIILIISNLINFKAIILIILCSLTYNKSRQNKMHRILITNINKMILAFWMNRDKT